MCRCFRKYINNNDTRYNQQQSDNSRQVGYLLKHDNTHQRYENNPNARPDGIGDAYWNRSERKAQEIKGGYITDNRYDARYELCELFRGF